MTSLYDGQEGTQRDKRQLVGTSFVHALNLVENKATPNKVRAQKRKKAKAIEEDDNPAKYNSAHRCVEHAARRRWRGSIDVEISQARGEVKK